MITKKADNTLRHQFYSHDILLDMPLPFQLSLCCDALFCLHLKFLPFS